MTRSRWRSEVDDTRHWLAISVVGLSVIGIVVAAALAIGFASSTDRPDVTQLVFTSALPLLGTWVGTVLAFYFARENLQTATESTLKLTGRGDLQTPVRLLMVPASRIEAYRLKVNEESLDIRLSELYARMQLAKRHRIPILNSQDAVLYVIHDSTIARFAASLEKNPREESQFTETVGNLLSREEFKKLIEAWGAVGPDAVLADARTQMRSIEGCNDVFVTSHGGRSDPIVGWITNSDLAEIE